jgi:hypothetical protein
MPTTHLRRCGPRVEVAKEEDIHVFNSVWDFFGEHGLGPSEWRFLFTSTCKHEYTVPTSREMDDDKDTSFREFFQCTKCNEKLYVRITFGCPVCKGRHLQFSGFMYDFYCPQNPTVPFRKKDIRGAQLEVYFDGGD